MSIQFDDSSPPEVVKRAEALMHEAKTSQVRSDRQRARRKAQQLRDLIPEVRKVDKAYAMEMEREACILGRFS